MAKKKDVTCGSCYKPIFGESFNVPNGKGTLSFHKDAHACASSSAPTRNAPRSSTRHTPNGTQAIKTQLEYGNG